MTRHAATLPHRASWGQDNGHHDFNSVSAIHPSARMALGLLRPLHLCPSGNPARDRKRRLHRICGVSPRLPPHCRCSGDRQPDLAVDGSDNCRHTTTLVAGKETSQTHTGSDWDPTDGPTAPSRGNAGRSLIAVKKILTTRGTKHIESATRSRLTFRFSDGVLADTNVFRLVRSGQIVPIGQAGSPSPPVWPHFGPIYRTPTCPDVRRIVIAYCDCAGLSVPARARGPTAQ